MDEQDVVGLLERVAKRLRCVRVTVGDAEAMHKGNLQVQDDAEALRVLVDDRWPEIEAARDFTKAMAVWHRFYSPDEGCDLCDRVNRAYAAYLAAKEAARAAE